MTETQVVTRKPFSPLLVALLAGVACVISYIPFAWIIGNSYRDPAITLSKEIELSVYSDFQPLWILSAIGMIAGYCFLACFARGSGKGSRALRFGATVSTAFFLAALTLNFLFAADDIEWLKMPGYFPFGENHYITLIAFTFAWALLWHFVSRNWTAWEMSRRGLHLAASVAMAVLLVAVPGRVVALEGRGFLAGLGTFIAIFFSGQILLVLGICGLWIHRRSPREVSVPENMHAVASRNALRDSVILSSAAFFLLILAYSIYPLVYRDRFTVTILGQIGFCVCVCCAAARGIKGYLLRTSRPFWILGIYILLAELALLIVWKLILPRMV